MCFVLCQSDCLEYLFYTPREVNACVEYGILMHNPFTGTELCMFKVGIGCHKFETVPLF